VAGEKVRVSKAWLTKLEQLEKRAYGKSGYRLAIAIRAIAMGIDSAVIQGYLQEEGGGRKRQLAE
jgi:hypothetical protein